MIGGIMVNIDIMQEIEEPCEINLDWFYHSTHYKKDDYKSILEEGIKCNHLLNRSWHGRYNGPYYISLSKVTIPDNNTFLYYASSYDPSFVLEGIEPIECKRILDYERYILTKDPRRIGNFIGEYQYYYWIEKQYIKGILYDLERYLRYSPNKVARETKIDNLLELISLLEELDIDIPIYDYSRREETLAHKIDKEKIKYYQKELL